IRVSRRVCNGQRAASRRPHRWHENTNNSHTYELAPPVLLDGACALSSPLFFSCPSFHFRWVGAPVPPNPPRREGLQPRPAQRPWRRLGPSISMATALSTRRSL